MVMEWAPKMASRLTLVSLSLGSRGRESAVLLRVLMLSLLLSLCRYAFFDIDILFRADRSFDRS